MLSLEEALAQLPDTADGIAAYLIERGLRGERDDGCKCPVANYLRAAGLPDPLVDPDDAYISGVDEAERVKLPVHVREFVNRFDDGAWPELATNPRRPW